VGGTYHRGGLNYQSSSPDDPIASIKQWWGGEAPDHLSGLMENRDSWRRSLSFMLYEPSASFDQLLRLFNRRVVLF